MTQKCLCGHADVTLRHGFWRCTCGQRWASVSRWLRSKKQCEDCAEDVSVRGGGGDDDGGVQEHSAVAGGFLSLAVAGPDHGQRADPDADTVDFDAWLRDGLGAGFCGPAVCFTHDGIPTSEAEDEEYDFGEPCLHILRLYPDDITRKAVERNHSPSIWRKPR